MAIRGSYFTFNSGVLKLGRNVLRGRAFVAHSLAVVGGVDPDHLTAEANDLILGLIR
jgi:hypothetical protein